MNYQEVRDRVNDNVGIESQSSKLFSQINFDIVSELKLVHRLSETPTKTFSFDILSSDTSPIEQDMPTDFFLPLGVKAESKEDGNKVATVEMPKERFFRWKPISLLPAGGAIQDIMPSEPKQVYQTSENFDYDYQFGWYMEFQEGVWKLFGKKPFDGTIDVLYAYVPAMDIGDTDTVNVIPYYEDVIVDGATIRAITRLITRAKTEIEILAFKTSLSGYITRYKKGMADIAGALHKTSELEPKMVHPFWLANDLSHEAY